MKELFKVRMAGPDDEAFIYSTWLKSFKESGYFAMRIHWDTYNRKHRILIEGILLNPKSKILVAVDKDDPSHIMGYLVTEDRILEDGQSAQLIHYAYVRPHFRRFGVASSLLRQSGIDISQALFTHWTTMMNEIITRMPKLKYDPYLAVAE